MAMAVDVEADDARSSGSSSFSSSSSSSDDDFLTSARREGRNGLGATQQDREALVRKKLLESFYGASSSASDAAEEEDGGCSTGEKINEARASDEHVVDGARGEDDRKIPDPCGGGGGDSSTLTDSQGALRLMPSQIPLPFEATKSDLDSPSFDSRSHTLSHIAHSSARTLLEQDENLALDIRSLDSTMQTLVYENYSKFIDATDAIRSIGTNVGSVSGESGLDRLVTGMDRIRDASARSERLLHESRDAVAEKLRVRRLLTRLDALLSLPRTLREHIDSGRYRMAVRSHASATEILGRHSAGFESLRSIEQECSAILERMAKNLKEKMTEWSCTEGSGGVIPDRQCALGMTSSNPKSIAEIFECAGTLLMLYPTSFSPGLNKPKCQSLALAACGLFLRERLGGHSISSLSAVDSSLGAPGRKGKGEDRNADGIISELPITFLDGILESATLFGVSFQVSCDSALEHSAEGAEQELLGQFVTANFERFIDYVRKFLTKYSEHIVGVGGDEGEEEESEEDANFRQVSVALSHLLRLVRELASGLALPEVGLDVSVASTLVDRMVELAEKLVRRHVATKFKELRVAVIKECLSPLVHGAIHSGVADDEEQSGEGEEKESKGRQHQPPSLVQIVQLSSVALSDGLQMADDLIRATLQRSQTGDVVPVDSAVMKLAVQKSAKSFGVWLASVLEQLVGCETSSDDSLLLEVWDDDGDNSGKEEDKIKILTIENEDENDHQLPSLTSTFSHMDSSAGTIQAQTHTLLTELIALLEKGATDRVFTNFLLAVCEMCRLAKRSMANTLNQSIQSAVEGEVVRVTDSASTLFGDAKINPHRKGRDGLDSEQILSKRFQLASSRSLAMYVAYRGACAASSLTEDLHLLSDAGDPYAIPSKPREECLRALEVAKESCEDCISIVGGDLFVLPVPPFPEEADYSDIFGDRLTGSNGGAGVAASSGLQLDVERMFIEKVRVHPHSLDRLELTRNSVISAILRVALCAFQEALRSSVLSSLGYRQMKVDLLFLRYIIPHFVKDDFSNKTENNCCSALFSIIDNIMLKAGQRCFDHEITNDDDYYDVEKDELVTPYQLVQRFVEGEQEGVVKRVAFS